MELQIDGKNIKLTPAVRHYIGQKLDKISRHLPRIKEFKVELTEEKTKSPQQRFVVKITVKSGRTVLRSENKGGNITEAIDKGVATMDRQVEHYKGKLYNKRKGSSFTKNELLHVVETMPPNVVKVKRFPVKPMSIAEAVDQMELLSHDFFLFFRADTEEINLLYKRKDGNYGLIEPELG
jgi:putative sigma-54 modulation protein